jgi:predicted Zn-dependent protease
LLPGDPEAQLAMAKTYVDLRQPAKALPLVRQLHGSTNISPWEVDRCEALAYIASQDYSSAEKVLNDAIRQDPNDENRVATLAEFYRVRGLNELRQRQDSQAAHDFAAALTNINLQLLLLASSSRDTAATFDVPDSLLKKAELETMLKSYGAAAATLGHLLQLQPDNYTALLNRALAEVQIKEFQAAKDDYKKFRKLLPRQSYLADLGLADVAALQENTAEEIELLKRCVKSAPRESGEYRMAAQRLAKLQSR